MARHIIIENFWSHRFEGDKSLAEEVLGWSESIKRDAQSDFSEYVFRYVVEQIGFNVLFYWVEDRNFYTIENERLPIEVRRLYPNPSWDGKSEFEKAGIDGVPNSSSPGEIIATFDDPSEIWGKLKINFCPIGEVLNNSVIIDLD